MKRRIKRMLGFVAIFAIVEAVLYTPICFVPAAMAFFNIPLPFEAFLILLLCPLGAGLIVAWLVTEPDDDLEAKER